MKETKDLFSKQASTYASFRPHYPDSLYGFIFPHLDNFDTAWDCATGNGQVANVLADKFKQVFATDISEKQLEHAAQRDNISYSVQRAEQTNFSDNSFDLITIGTALHWFDFLNFYKEAQRVAKPGCIIAAWAYSLFRSQPDIDTIIDDFGFNILGDYWDKERKWVDEQYKTIPFTFEEIPVPEMFIDAQWSFSHCIGYLSSWSSVQHYINKNGINPVSFIEDKLRTAWKEETIAVSFSLCVKMGMINK